MSKFIAKYETKEVADFLQHFTGDKDEEHEEYEHCSYCSGENGAHYVGCQNNFSPFARLQREGYD